MSGASGLGRDAYAEMHEALEAAGCPIVYSLCQYGWDAVWEWGAAAGGNLWRTTGDIRPSWDSIYAIVQMQNGLAAHAGPGHWNDPDMPEVGNGDLSLAESRAHFSWWAMLAAPLIAIDQDPLGKQGTRACADGEMEVWTRPLADGALAVAIFNVGSSRDARPCHIDSCMARSRRATCGRTSRPRSAMPCRSHLAATTCCCCALPAHADGLVPQVASGGGVGKAFCPPPRRNRPRCRRRFRA